MNIQLPVRMPIVGAGFQQTLNDAQRAAVAFGIGSQAPAPALLIIAGAGTGKTATLAHRVAALVSAGTDPTRILLLTFTRRAALEMTRRATGTLGGTMRLPWSGTFHAIANRLLREFAMNLGLAREFSVLDRGDSADLLDLIRQERNLAASRRRFPRKDSALLRHAAAANWRPPRLRRAQPVPGRAGARNA